MQLSTGWQFLPNNRLPLTVIVECVSDFLAKGLRLRDWIPLRSQVVLFDRLTLVRRGLEAGLRYRGQHYRLATDALTFVQPRLL